jgi:hypothetical protein
LSLVRFNVGVAFFLARTTVLRSVLYQRRQRVHPRRRDNLAVDLLSDGKRTSRAGETIKKGTRLELRWWTSALVVAVSCRKDPTNIHHARWKKITIFGK